MKHTVCIYIEGAAVPFKVEKWDTAERASARAANLREQFKRNGWNIRVAVETEDSAPTVLHTECKHCALEIEGVAPFPAGDWRDRGNNTHCPTPIGSIFPPLPHAPIEG